jgi:hypothetical protein
LRARVWASPGFWLYMALFSLYLLTMGGQLFISDGVAMYLTTRAIVRDHTLAVEPDQGLPQLVKGWDGHLYSQYDLGQPLIAVPFYIAGSILARLFPRGDEGALTVFTVSLLPQFATALAGLVLYQLSFGVFRNTRVAIAVALLWGTGTLAWPYSKFYFSEALLTLFLVLSCWLMVEAINRDSRVGLLCAGLALGAAVSIRAATAIYLPAFVAYLMVEVARTGAEPKKLIGQMIGTLTIFLLGILPSIVLFLWHNYIRFHDILHIAYEGQGFTTPFWIGLTGFLFSPGRSLFLFSPLLVLGVLSLYRLRHEAPSIAAFIITAFIAVLAFYSLWWSWHGGWSWGPRFLVPLFPFLVLPVGVRLRSGKFWFATILVWILSVLAVIPGVSVDFNRYFIDSLYVNNLREYSLWFDPIHSQLLVQWQYLLEGKALTFAGNHLSDFGLPQVVNHFYVPIIGLVLLLSLVRLTTIYLTRMD